MPAKNLIYFEDLALSLEKDKKSFFHGVHIINVRNGCPAVKTAGHPPFPGFFTLKMPVKKECVFKDIIGVIWISPWI